MVFRHRNAGPKMGPFSEPSVIVPILEGSRNGPGFRAPFLVPLFTLSERRFSQKMVASRCCCDDHNLSQFLSCFRSQHDSLSCCRIRRATRLCSYAIDQTKQDNRHWGGHPPRTPNHPNFSDPKPGDTFQLNENNKCTTKSSCKIETCRS